MVSRLRDQARTYLIWRSIVNDIDEDELNLDLFQAKQSRGHAEGAEQALHQLVREAKKWLVCAAEEFIPDRCKRTLRRAGGCRVSRRAEPARGDREPLV